MDERTKAYGKLIAIAARLVRGAVEEEIVYPTRTPLWFKRQDRKAREAVNNDMRDTAMELRKAADMLRGSTPSGGAADG